MKKIFTRLAVALTASSLVLPLTGCVYNFYVNSATNAVIKSYADQTSIVLKSLVLGKTKNADTAQTIQDIFETYPNLSVQNHTRDKSVASWDEFEALWGLNKEIKIAGFNPDDEFFVKSGDGSLTQQVNTYKTVNNVLNQINLVSGLNVATNRLLYNLIKDEGDIKSTIVNFLNQTKNPNKDELDTITLLLKNIVLGPEWDKGVYDENAFTKSVTNPLTSLLNYLNYGLWTKDQSTPTGKPEFQDFMTNWKDEGGKPFSQWNDGSAWNLDEEYYDNWTPSDYNFYRSGVLLNHLFYQIGKDYQIKKWVKSGNPPEYRDRYLGDIISDQAVGGDMMADLGQYLPYLLQNPAYIITIIEAVVPIIKQWALKMSDITKGVKKLTFGDKYPNDDANNSYNIRNVLDNLYQLINYDKDVSESALKGVLEDLFALHGYATGSTFTYDINITLLSKPLPELYDVVIVGPIVKKAVEGLINDTILGLLRDNDVKGIFTNIIDNIYEPWIKQYNDNDDGLVLDLESFQDYLLNDTTGLVTIINEQLIKVLYNIMKNPNPITEKDDSEYFQFYEGLGGQLPPSRGEEAPLDFKENSILSILKRDINDTNSVFGQLVLILVGNSSNNNTGLFSYIVDSNNQWLADNYTNFFDATNKGIGRIYNQTMTIRQEGNAIIRVLTYNFNYTIDKVTYSFAVKCQSYDDIDTDIGVKKFYFSDITLRS